MKTFTVTLNIQQKGHLRGDRKRFIPYEVKASTPQSALNKATGLVKKEHKGLFQRGYIKSSSIVEETTLSLLQKEKSFLMGKAGEIQDLIVEELKKTKIKCSDPTHYRDKNCCGEEFEISEAVYIEKYWYESTSGNFYEYEDSAEIICPKCGARNRIYSREELKKLKHYFKEIKKEDA